MTINYQLGQTVYVIMRNPHTQDVANIQEAIIQNDPESSETFSLFVNETFYPLNDEVAVFQTSSEAEKAFEKAFTSLKVEETKHG